MTKAIKFGGIALSAIFTFSFFLRTFHYTVQAWLIAFFALALYEGAVTVWTYALTQAREGQRPAAWVGLIVSGALSIASTLAEFIILAGFGGVFEGLPLDGINVLLFWGALTCGIVCGTWYELENPITRWDLREKEQQGKLAAIQGRQFDATIKSAETKAEGLIRDNAAQLGEMLAQSALSATQRAVQHAAAGYQVIDNPPQRPQLNNGAGGYSYQATAAPAPNVRPAPQYAPSGPSTPHSAAYDDDSRYFDDTAQPQQHAAPAAQPTTPAEERETTEDANANTPKAAARPQRKKQGA